MLKVAILFNQQTLFCNFSVVRRADGDSGEQDLHSLSPILINAVKSYRTWTKAVVDDGLMPRVTRNRLPIEVEVTASDGIHWHGIVERTQEAMNDALLKMLKTEGMVNSAGKEARG